MMHEDIIRMMRESGLKVDDTNPPDAIERFVAIIAAAEREACAKVCEDIPLPANSEALTHLPTIERCAAAIRARGER